MSLGHWTPKPKLFLVACRHLTPGQGQLNNCAASGQTATSATSGSCPLCSPVEYCTLPGAEQLIDCSLREVARGCQQAAVVPCLSPIKKHALGSFLISAPHFSFLISALTFGRWEQASLMLPGGPRDLTHQQMTSTGTEGRDVARLRKGALSSVQWVLRMEVGSQEALQAPGLWDRWTWRAVPSHPTSSTAPFRGQPHLGLLPLGRAFVPL